MNQMLRIDTRPIPSTLPPELARATAYAAELRSSPVLRAYSESLIAAQCGQTLGLPIGFNLWPQVEIDQFKKLVSSDPPPELLEAIRVANFRISPLTTALILGHARRNEFDAGDHLRLISDRLCDAVCGLGKRFLGISMPPRHGKSTLVSMYTPAWLIGCYPHAHVGVICYNDGFAEVFGRLIRNCLLDSPEIFGFGLSNDSTAASHWSTQFGGSLWTSGVSGSITGRSADLLICDDPVKNFAEATSARAQDELFSWWVSTARTRLFPWSVCTIVATRWASSDLLGRLIGDGVHGYQGTDATEWNYLSLPAVWEKDTPDALGRRKGESLWPSHFDVAELQLTRGAIGEETWSALYQGTPIDATSIGRVFHAFSDKNNIRECSYDPRCKLAVSLDFNVDPGSCLIAQTREFFGPRAYLTNERVIEIEVLAEISLPNSNTQMICDELIARLRAMLAGYSVTHIDVTGDASGNSRRSSAAESDWEIVRNSLGSAQGLSVSFQVPDANPHTKDTTNAVNAFLQNANGQSRLWIDPSCVQLLADMRTVRWKRDSSGSVTSLIDKSDSKRTHMSDALRYLVYGRRDGQPVFGFVAELAQ